MVKVYNCYVSPTTIFIVMELVRGLDKQRDLFEYIVNASPVMESQSRHIFYDLIKAVDELHDVGVVHRDLKLENILLNELGEPMIIDFGMSARFNHSTVLR